MNINLNNKSNNDNDEDTADDNPSQSDREGDNFSSEKNKNKFSFYKKPKNILYNNIIKLKRKEKNESTSFNKDNSLRNTKNSNCGWSLVKKKENKNFSLKKMNVISLRQDKHITEI